MDRGRRRRRRRGVGGRFVCPAGCRCRCCCRMVVGGGGWTLRLDQTGRAPRGDERVNQAKTKNPDFMFPTGARQSDVCSLLFMFPRSSAIALDPAPLRHRVRHRHHKLPRRAAVHPGPCLMVLEPRSGTLRDQVAAEIEDDHSDAALSDMITLIWARQLNLCMSGCPTPPPPPLRTDQQMRLRIPTQSQRARPGCCWCPQLLPLTPMMMCISGGTGEWAPELILYSDSGTDTLPHQSCLPDAALCLPVDAALLASQERDRQLGPHLLGPTA